VESPEHALLECIENAEITLLREQFISDVTELSGVPLNLQQQNLTQCLKELISSRECIARLAEFTYDVLEVFDKYPIHVPTTTVL
jgi:hypothetical protein